MSVVLANLRLSQKRSQDATAILSQVAAQLKLIVQRTNSRTILEELTGNETEAENNGEKDFKYHLICI